MKITDEPKYLTSGRRTPDDPNKLIVTRAALAAAFAIGVDAPSRNYEILWGTYSIAVVGLDHAEARNQVWFDLWTVLDQAEQHLRARIMEVQLPG
ncbi:hypothetical protein [Rugosimonospora africana]|nr:hypothetical protein [Rugosimonospora africana]